MVVIGNLYVITAVAVIGGALFGFDISSMSVQLGTNQFKCYFNQGPDGPPFNNKRQCTGMSSGRQGGVTAAMPAGSWLGALVSGLISDKLGRKKAIMIGCIFWCIGSAIISASQNVAMLVVGRVINGWAVGFESAQVPVYVSELAPPSKRGRVVGTQQWAITWGILIMYYISYGCSFIGGGAQYGTNPAAFRIPWALQMIPAILLFFSMLLMPESPRWLAKKDRWEDCHKVLTLVHGKGDPDSPFVRIEMQDIQEMVEFERRNKDASYMDLLKPNMLNRTIVGLFMQIWSQLTGMNIMMYYITYVFGMAGYSGNANLLASSIQYIINVLMTVPALIWIDRWGRRPALLVGAALMATFMYANAGIMGKYGVPVPGGINGVPEESRRLSGAPAKGLIACTYLFVASYAPTWGPVSWIYPPELYPLRLRGKGVSLSTSGNWVFNTALGVFTPSAFQNISYQTYIIFGVFCTVMWFHVFFFFPETAGKTLEETEAIFEDPNGIKYIGTPAWRTRNTYGQISKLEHGNVEPDKLGSFHHEGSGAATTAARLDSVDAEPKSGADV